MTDAIASAFRSPVPNVSELEFVLDMQAYLEPHVPACDDVKNISKPHQFIIRSEPEADGPVKSSVSCKKWSDTPETDPCHVLLSLPTGTPFTKAGRQLFHRHDSPGVVECDKRYEDFEKELCKIFTLYQVSVSVQDEWEHTFDWLEDLQLQEAEEFPGFWPLDPEELEDYIEENSPLDGLRLAPIPQGLQEPIPDAVSTNARLAAAIRTDIDDRLDFQGLFRRRDGIGYRQVFDAKRGNLVVLDARGAVDAEDDDFLGDWEKEVFVGYVRSTRYREGASEDEKQEEDPEEIEILCCEPWSVDPETGKADRPLWLVKATSASPVCTTWEHARHLLWKPVHALPMSVYRNVYEASYTNTRPITRDPDFMGSGIPAIVRLDLQEANYNQAALVLKQPYAQLQYTCIADPSEKTDGARFPQEALDRIERHMELVQLGKSMVNGVSASLNREKLARSRKRQRKARRTEE